MAGGERDALVLELVRGVIAEVHPHASRQAVTLDSRFDELGIGSLELVELLQRVQNTFGVTLPSELVGRAETPRDLLQAIAANHAPAQEDHGVFSPPSAVAGSPAPATASTLIDALDWHVSATPERTHIRILDESGSPDDMTYAALHREAAAVAAGLLARDVMPGDTVAIMLPTSPAYFSTFAGVLLAGAVPVPLYPPARPSRLSDHLRRHTGILANARAALLVTVPEAVSVGRLLRANVEGLRHVVVPESLMGAMDADLPRPRSVDLALLQYTSGSTGQPKGVALTHANLLANIRAMGQAAAVSGADTFVSWLPLYHDMGLIGAWLSSLYFGMPLVVMAPQVFLTRPSRWLAAIHANHGTISAGPNFGYELCLSKISDAELEGLDLSSWRLAFNGAEPVSPMTIERFTERFAPNGFRRDAMAPVYGLAESSVGLAFPPLGRGPLIDRVDRDTFVRSGRPESATPGQRDALRFVACGQPLPGHEIRIVDATGHELGDRREGRIEFRGPSATAGYFHNPDATRALFHGDWLDTGDLGYIADADLYVTGRVKVKVLARLTGTVITVNGLDRLPAEPSIVVANHPSWLDAVVLVTVLPPCFRFVAGEVLERQVLSGFVLKRLGTEFVERYEREQGVADTDRVVALVRAGQSLVIFPEGHLNRAPGLRTFHMGAFVAAARAGVPVVPIAIGGTRAMLRPGHRFPRWGAVGIAIGAPIRPVGPDWAAAVELQHATRDAVLRLSGEPDVE